MKRTMYKFALLLLVLIMSISFLAACAGEETGSGGNEVVNGDENVDTGTMDEDVDEPFSYSTMVITWAEIPNMENDFWTRFQDENSLDLDIEWIPSDEFDNVLDLRLASGDLPDVVSVQNPQSISVLNAIEDGVFWDLDPFLGDLSEYPNLQKAVSEDAWDYTVQADGSRYFVPRARAQLNNGYMIRKDLLDEVDMPIPETTDELHEALKAVIDNDDSGNLMGTRMFAEMSPAFGTYEPEFDDEGGMYHMVLTDSYTDMIEWYRGLYEDGLMSPEFAAITGPQGDDMFGGGISVFTGKNYWHQYRFEQEAKRVDPDAEVEIIPYLEGPGGYSQYIEPGFTGGLMIPTDVPEERVEQILDVFELAANDENSHALFYGYEGTHHTLEDGEPVMTDQGLTEIQSFTNDPFTIQRNEWDKVDSPLAPPEVDMENRGKVEPAYDVLSVDPYRVINSPTWTTQWAQHADEFERVRTQAINGDITMDEYREYIQDLRDIPELREAFQELAEDYALYFD